MSINTKAAFVVLLIIITNNITAQKSVAYLKGGLNLANISINKSGNIDDANDLSSFQAGIIGDMPVTDFLSIQTGLLFTGKGSKTQSGNTADANYYRASSNPQYLELPLNLIFKSSINKTNKLFAGAGPYIAMGVSGKRKAEGKIFGVAFKSENNIKFSNDDPTTSGEEGAGFGIIKRFDYGLNGTIGIEGEKVLFSFNYGLGLAKLQSGTNNSTDDLNKHRVMSFAIGFKL